jgi:hypothetical protein
MENDDPWLPLLIERHSGETQLFAKQAGRLMKPAVSSISLRLGQAP